MYVLSNISLYVVPFLGINTDTNLINSIVQTIQTTDLISPIYYDTHVENTNDTSM